MKYRITLLLSFTLTSAFSQSIDFSLLYGKWICYKATMDTTNVTDTYKGIIVTFNKDLTYIEDFYPNNSTTGKYNLNIKTNQIILSNLVNRTKYPDAKFKVEDLVFKLPTETEIIISLDKNFLVVLLKGKPNTERINDIKLYYKRKT
jgi:hypothetical protein